MKKYNFSTLTLMCVCMYVMFWRLKRRSEVQVREDIVWDPRAQNCYGIDWFHPSFFEIKVTGITLVRGRKESIGRPKVIEWWAVWDPCSALCWYLAPWHTLAIAYNHVMPQNDSPHNTKSYNASTVAISATEPQAASDIHDAVNAAKTQY